MKLHRLALGATAVALTGVLGFAQSFNIDIGPTTPFGTPSSGFGAASGQTGIWQGVTTGQAQAGAALTDINGNATGVTLTAVPTATFAIADFQFDNTATTGDVQALMDDLCDSSTSSWTFNGLANGQYTVYVYSWAPDNRTTFFSDITVTGGSAGLVHCGGQLWTGTFNNPANFMQDTVTVTGGTLVINVANPPAITPTSVNGIQLVSSGCGLTVTYCVSKINSLGCSPAISATGTPSASAGAGFVVNTVQVRNQKPGIYLYSNQGQINSTWATFAGPRCVGSAAGANIRRTPGVGSGGTPLPTNDCTGVYTMDFNTFAVGGLGGTPAAYLITPGTMVQVQCWGRDPGFAPPDNVTLSNGLEYTVCP